MRLLPTTLHSTPGLLRVCQSGLAESETRQACSYPAMHPLSACFGKIPQAQGSSEDGPSTALEKVRCLSAQHSAAMLVLARIVDRAAVIEDTRVGVALSARWLVGGATQATTSAGSTMGGWALL